MRTKPMATRLVFAALLVLGLLFTGTAWAEFPDSTISIIVGRGAGGSTDSVTRTFAPYLEKHLGVPVVVKNIRGAGGQMAIRELLKAEPDGYTLLAGVFPADITRQIRRDPGYDVREDVDFIHSIAGGDTNGLFVGTESPYETFDEFAQAAEEKTMTFSATTPGGNSWLLLQFIRKSVDFKDLRHVTFDSGNAAVMAIVGGHVDAGIANSINFPDMVAEGQIRVLGVGSEQRLDYLPEVPTFAELGYPDVQTVSRQILVGPKGIPAGRVQVLAQAAAKAVEDPEFKAKAENQGFSREAMGPEEARQKVHEVYESIYSVLEQTGNLKREQ